MKESETKQKNEMGAKNEEAGKPKAGFTPTDQDEEKSGELKETVTEQKNELRPKPIYHLNQRQELCLQIQMRINQRD